MIKQSDLFFGKVNYDRPDSMTIRLGDKAQDLTVKRKVDAGDVFNRIGNFLLYPLSVFTKPRDYEFTGDYRTINIHIRFDNTLWMNKQPPYQDENGHTVYRIPADAFVTKAQRMRFLGNEGIARNQFGHGVMVPPSGENPAYVKVNFTRARASLTGDIHRSYLISMLEREGVNGTDMGLSLPLKYFPQGYLKFCEKKLIQMYPKSNLSVDTKSDHVHLKWAGLGRTKRVKVAGKLYNLFKHAYYDWLFESATTAKPQGHRPTVWSALKKMLSNRVNLNRHAKISLNSENELKYLLDRMSHFSAAGNAIARINPANVILDQSMSYRSIKKLHSRGQLQKDQPLQTLAAVLYILLIVPVLFALLFKAFALARQDVHIRKIESAEIEQAKRASLFEDPSKYEEVIQRGKEVDDRNEFGVLLGLDADRYFRDESDCSDADVSSSNVSPSQFSVTSFSSQSRSDDLEEYCGIPPHVLTARRADFSDIELGASDDDSPKLSLPIIAPQYKGLSRRRQVMLSHELDADDKEELANAILSKIIGETVRLFDNRSTPLENFINISDLLGTPPVNHKHLRLPQPLRPKDISKIGQKLNKALYDVLADPETCKSYKIFLRQLEWGNKDADGHFVLKMKERATARLSV